MWAMLVTVVVGILSSSYFLNTMNENALVKRHIAAVRAFWTAEAGLAEAVDNMPSSTSGTIESSNYAYSTTTVPLGVDDYYTVTSRGTVTLPSGGSVTRVLNAVVRIIPPDASKFQHAIRTTVALDIKGSVDINGDTEEYAALDFPDLFSNTKAEVEEMATHTYTNPANNITPVDDITWVNLSEGNQLRINNNGWTGSGILVVTGGNVHITGGTFDGILYVVGDLFISGNPIINGSVLVESDTEVVDDTDITGNPTINFDSVAIADALDTLGFAASEIVSWQDEGEE